MKDNIGIILKGVKESEQGNGIELVRTLNAPSIKLFEDVDSIKTENAEGDRKSKFKIKLNLNLLYYRKLTVLDSIEAAITAFKKEYGKKKWIKRVNISSNHNFRFSFLQTEKAQSVPIHTI